ncbi:MAG TPA: lysophospholipid acyltransferase family protein [Negativicutes bacterium]|nr:lysophospholipid acyltransferase family protein [Negativicutes bacterium]
MFYYVVRFIFRLIFKLVFRWQVTGRENIPATGGVIIAPNHVSNVDPPLVGSAMNRRVTIMAKEELFSFALFGYLIRRLGAFPIKRGTGDRGAIKTALEALRTGQALLLFPEGTRSKNGELNKAQHGISLIALKSQMPVIPVAHSGTFKFFRNGKWFPRFIVRFGKPLYPPSGVHSSKEVLDEFGASIMQEIRELLKQDA